VAAARGRPEPVPEPTQLAFVPPAASPIRRQYLSLKLQHPGAILFFQLGDFYETFEDDARVVADVCEIALTSREMGRGERLPMAGVPVHSAEVYIGRLVERGHHIAICQQMEDPATAARAGSSVVRREVTRVITPGTLVDPALLAAERANYLAAACRDGSRIGIAHADISTGEFACMEVQGPGSEEQAHAELWRLRPAECLVADEATAVSLAPEGSAATVDERLFSTSDGERIVCAHFRVASTAALGLAERPMAVRAVAGILRYLERTQPRAASAIEQLRIYAPDGHMVLDPATRSHLELIEGPRGRREGSLVQAMDRTRTAMGGRLLAAWLGHPLLEKAQIEARLDAVEALAQRHSSRQELRTALAQVPDLQRLAGRAAQRLLAPREALALAHALDGAARLRELCADVGTSLEDLTSRIDPPLEVAADIRATLVDDPPPEFGDGVIRRGRVAELDDLRASSSDGRDWLLALEKRERDRTGLKNLKVGYNRVFGYYLEVSAASLGQALDYYRRQETGAVTVSDLLERLGYQRRQTLASVERFTAPELREHEVRQTRRAAQMAELERRAYDELSERIARHCSRLAGTALAVAELDVFSSFAEVAQERRYVRPEILDRPETEIVGGRHPVVEGALGWDAYIPADVHLRSGQRPEQGTGVGGEGSGDGGPEPRDAGQETGDGGQETEDSEVTAHARPLGPELQDESGAPTLDIQAGPRPLSPDPQDDAGGARVILLTGPNMAGKTTYGRMALLVTLLGQCGSFVPAERARLGLVDRIFLRSGAGDDIAGGQSTFMVEMTEAAAILRNATPRSLAFFDEIGRGTSTYDGMAIARAIVERLASEDLGFRTIFSTHYHELASIASETPAVRNYRMEARDSGDQVWFTYRVVPGSADRSYGVHVAQLAGLPAGLVARAREILVELEGNAGDTGQGTGDRGQDGEGQGPLEAGHLTGPRPTAPDRVPDLVYDLANIDVERTTPLDALRLLERFHAEAVAHLARRSGPGAAKRSSNTG